MYRGEERKKGRKKKKRKRKKILIHKLNHGSHGKQHGGCEARHMNSASDQWCTVNDNRYWDCFWHFTWCWMDKPLMSTTRIKQSGNYCYSALRVASINEVKNTVIERLSWLSLKPYVQTALPFMRVKKGRVLLRLELWLSVQKILQLQNASTNKDYLNVKAQYI